MSRYTFSMAETHPKLVTVYTFEAWDKNVSGGYVLMPYKSPEWRIKEYPKARIIPGTAKQVDAARIDHLGRYLPNT